jgi:hypothetical protein
VGPVVGFLLSLSANDPPSAGQEKKRHRGHWPWIHQLCSGGSEIVEGVHHRWRISWAK